CQVATGCSSYSQVSPSGMLMSKPPNNRTRSRCRSNVTLLFTRSVGVGAGVRVSLTHVSPASTQVPLLPDASPPDSSACPCQLLVSPNANADGGVVGPAIATCCQSEPFQRQVSWNLTNTAGRAMPPCSSTL